MEIFNLEGKSCGFKLKYPDTCERGLKITISKTASFHRWGKKQLKKHTADSINVASGIINCTNRGGHSRKSLHCSEWPNTRSPMTNCQSNLYWIRYYGFHNIWQVAGFEISINVQEYFSRWQRWGWSCQPGYGRFALNPKCIRLSKARFKRRAIAVPSFAVLHGSRNRFFNFVFCFGNSRSIRLN